MNTTAAAAAPAAARTVMVPVPRIAVTLLALYLVAIIVAAGLGAYRTWPIVETKNSEAEVAAAAAARAAAGQREPGPEVLLAQARAALEVAAREKAAEAKEKAAAARELEHKERSLARFVLYLGILGACIHAMTSMATYVGNKTFLKSWATWYLLRPFIGGALAWLVFLVFRGGFLGGAGVDVVNPYAFGALGAMSGLFSKRVIDKLSELVDTMFRMPAGQGDDARANKAIGTGISITGVQPTELSLSAETTTLAITGAGFTPGSVVELGGTPLKPTSIQPTQVKVEVPVEAYIGRTAVEVLVKAREPKGTASNSVAVKIVK